ncbi:hypothetical protein Tco_1204200 [Tanacetum coccineum]
MTLTNKLLVIKIRSILKKAQQIQPTLYDGSVIAKEHAVISVINDEETLLLEEESRSKMLDKQNDPISIENKIKISPIDYSKLNKIKEDFGKRFVTQKELSTEQAFWLKHSSFSKIPVTSHTLVKIEAPSKLLKDNAIREALKRLKDLSHISGESVRHRQEYVRGVIFLGEKLVRWSQRTSGGNVGLLTRKQNMCLIRLLCPSPFDGDQLTDYGYTSQDSISIVISENQPLPYPAIPIQNTRDKQKASLFATPFHKRRRHVD